MFIDHEEILVDDEYRHILRSRSWQTNDQGYVVGSVPKLVREKTKSVRLHRLIMQSAGYDVEGMDIDHISGDRLDNRVSNLRVVTRSQNNMNRVRQSNNTSGHVGITWVKSKCKWRARIMVNRVEIALGSYANLEDAIEARKKGEEKYFGEYGFRASRG